MLGQERQPRLHKTKTAITEIKAVKLCRNCNLKDLLSELVSYVSKVFDHLLQREKHIFSVRQRTATQNLAKRYFFELAPVFCMRIHFKPD